MPACLWCEIHPVTSERNPNGLCLSCAYAQKSGELEVASIGGNTVIRDPLYPEFTRPYYPDVLYERESGLETIAKGIDDYYRECIRALQRIQHAREILTRLTAMGCVFSWRGCAIRIDNPSGIGDNLLCEFEAYRTEIEDIYRGDLPALQKGTSEPAARSLLELLLHARH